MKRVAIILAALGTLSATPAAACFIPDWETYTFLPALPQSLPEDSVVLLVRAPDSFDYTADSVKLEVQSAEAGEWTDKYVEVHFGHLTSCSRREFLVPTSYVVGTRSAVPGRLNAQEFRLRDLRGITFLEDGKIAIERKSHDVTPAQ